MADHRSGGPIQVMDVSVQAVNLALGQVLERLDTALGLRGTAQVHSPVGIEAPTITTEAARLADLPTLSPLVLASIYAAPQRAWQSPGLLMTPRMP